MRILITGGTGLIGRALSKALVEDGDEVIVLSRSLQPTRTLAGVKLAVWDGASARGWADAAEGADAIINLAGENLAAGRWTPERKKAIRASRINAGRAVVEVVQAVQNKPKAVIQASGIGCYGSTGEQEIDESFPYGSDFLSGICVDWEASTAPVEAWGVRRVILRTGIVLSAQGGAMQPLVLASRLFAGGSLGHGRQWWPWIHIEDQVGAIRFLLRQRDASGVFNLTAPNPVRMAEFGRTLASVLNRPYWLPAPAVGLKLLLGEMSCVVLDGQRAYPRRLLELGYEFKFKELYSALAQLFRPADQIKLE